MYLEFFPSAFLWISSFNSGLLFASSFISSSPSPHFIVLSPPSFPPPSRLCVLSDMCFSMCAWMCAWADKGQRHLTGVFLSPTGHPLVPQGLEAEDKIQCILLLHVCWRSKPSSSYLYYKHFSSSTLSLPLDPDLSYKCSPHGTWPEIRTKCPDSVSWDSSPCCEVPTALNLEGTLLHDYAASHR